MSVAEGGGSARIAALIKDAFGFDSFLIIDSADSLHL